VTGVSIVLAGAPFTPVSHYMDKWLMELLPTHPLFAGTIMFGHFVVSVVLIRFLLLNVPHTRWFHKKPNKSVQPKHSHELKRTTYDAVQ